MKNYKFSIIINIYNLNLFYVKRSIESILSQNYLNYECIIIDDGSDEKFIYSEYYNELLKSNSKFKYHYHKNIGLGPSRNVGIKISKCDYILFLDGDDYLSYDSLSFLNSLIIKFGEIDMIHFNHFLLKNNKVKGKNKNIISYIKTNNNNLSLKDFKQLQRLKFCYNLKFIKKNKLFFLDSRDIHEDVFYNLITKTVMNKIVFTNKKLYFYDISRCTSISNSTQKKNDEKFINYIIEAHNFLKNNNYNLERFYLYIIYYINVFINKNYMKSYWLPFFKNNYYLEKKICITTINKIMFFLFKHKILGKIFKKIYSINLIKKIIKMFFW